MQENNHAEKKDIKSTLIIISIVVSIILVLVIVYMLTNSITDSAKSAVDSFNSSYEQTKKDTYNEFYNAAYLNAEKDNHVSNRESIVIDQIKKISNLEVYKAYDTEYVINEYSTNKYESWYELNGSCTYFIDLQKSEFLVDQERNAITIRIPDPEQKYDIDVPKRLLFADDTITFLWWDTNNGSTIIGIDDAHNSEVEGREKIKNYFINNETLINNAKNSAVKVLTNLVEGVNSKVENLTVTIEFLE